jgi:hypothetical protein
MPHEWKQVSSQHSVLFWQCNKCGSQIGGAKVPDPELTVTTFVLHGPSRTHTCEEEIAYSIQDS